MPRRHILTERQRSALLDLPIDELSLLRHYTLGDDDLGHIQERRRPENRLGFALQLCALRYPGRALAPGEVIPHEVLSFIGAQLGVPADALLTYAARRQTRQEHMEALREIYGYKTFSGRGARDLRDWLSDQAEDARSNEDLAQRLVARCRETQTILPAVSTIERLCADALVAAERRIETRIAERLDDDARERLDGGRFRKRKKSYAKRALMPPRRGIGRTHGKRCLKVCNAASLSVFSDEQHGFFGVDFVMRNVQLEVLRIHQRL